jgi:hypothetical protein
MSLPDELAKLAQLHKDGHLTDEEYTLAKRKVLAEPPEPKPSPAEPEPSNTPVTSQSQRTDSPAPTPGPWTAIEQSVVTESEPIRRNQRSGSGSFAVIAMWVLALVHFVGFVRFTWYSGSFMSRPGPNVSYPTLLPLSTILVLAAVQACVFLTLAIWSFRQPFYCACIALSLFLAVGIAKTAMDFYDAHQISTESWREQVYERLYIEYGIGWSFRLVLVVMLCLGIYDSRRVRPASA